MREKEINDIFIKTLNDKLKECISLCCNVKDCSVGEPVLFDIYDTKMNTVEKYNVKPIDYTKVKVKTKFPSMTRSAEELILECIDDVRSNLKNDYGFSWLDKLTKERKIEIINELNKIKVEVNL